jgi:hypothetical protein
MPIGIPGTEGIKLANFSTLRFLAENYSVARACINVRIQEILGLEWDIVPTDEAEKEMRGNSSKHGSFQDRKAEAIKFFKRPDYNYYTHHGWLSAILEDLFVCDNVSLHLHPPRKGGKGLLGSNLAALNVIHGDTIRPLLDVHGEYPAPPAPAYQQYLWGVPRSDLMSVINEADKEELGPKIDEYGADQLLYLRYFPRAWTPYGFSALEQAIVPVMTGLKRQQQQLDYFTEGTIPAVYISPGPDISTPHQIRELQDTLNAIAGDVGFKHKVIVLPPGSKTEPQKPMTMADQWDEIIFTSVLMAFAVMPMELGISPKVSTTQSPGAAYQMAKASKEVNERKALKPLLMWLKANIFDYVLQTICEQDDMEFVWTDMQQGIDEEMQVGLLKEKISVGLMSVDEARGELGLDPWGLPMTSDPVYLAATGPVPFGNVDPEEEEDAEDFDRDPIVSPEEAQDEPTQPPPPPGGGTTVSPLHGASDGQDTPDRPDDSGREATNPTQKALGEIDLIRRRLKKKGSLAGWTARYVSQETLDRITFDVPSIGVDAALAKARRTIRGKKRLEQREKALAPIKATIRAGLLTLAKAEIGRKSKSTFVKNAQTLLQNGYTDAWQAGADDSSDEYGSDAVPPNTDAIDKKTDKQAVFLGGLFAAIMGRSQSGNDNQDPEAQVEDSFGSRFDMYGDGTQSMYEQGYGETAVNGGMESIEWVSANDSEVCSGCVDNAGGSPYTLDTLPGWPGDGGFGDLCDGGPRCRCYLVYTSPTGEVIDSTESAAEAELTKKGRGNRGNPAALIRWFNAGAGGQIKWGQKGDFEQCVAIARKHMDDAEGFCNLRHQDAVGGPPGSEGRKK